MVDANTDYTVYISPFAGYHIADVLVDGVSVNAGYKVGCVVVDGRYKGAITSYTFDNVTYNGHYIKVWFYRL